MINTTHSEDQVFNKTNENQFSLEASAQKAKVVPVCYRCAQVPQNGFYDGFRVKGMFFCSDCQQDMFAAKQDSPEYHEFLFLIQEALF